MNRSETSFSVASSRRNSVVNKQFKVILIGDSMVGKTSIIQRYIDNMFIDSGGTQPTLAWDFKTKVL
jgi:GTPase SAR1 family protein